MFKFCRKESYPSGVYDIAIKASRELDSRLKKANCSVGHSLRNPTTGALDADEVKHIEIGHLFVISEEKRSQVLVNYIDGLTGKEILKLYDEIRILVGAKRFENADRELYGQKVFRGTLYHQNYVRKMTPNTSKNKPRKETNERTA